MSIVDYLKQKEAQMLNKVNSRLVILAFLLLALPLAILLAVTPTKVQKRAEGSKEVSLKFVPSSGSYNRGSPLSLKMAIYNLTTRQIVASGVQSVINVANEFTIDSVTCEAPFNGLPFVRIDAQRVTVMCAIAAGATPVNLTAGETNFATLNLTVKDTAVDGTTAAIAFSSTRVTEAGVPGQAPDVSTAGEAASYTIGGQGGPTETPTPPPTGQVGIVFSPSTAFLPPDTNFKIMADSGSQSVAFGRIVFTFDPTKIQLTDEIGVPSQIFRIVEKTSKINANSLGKAVIVLGVDPSATAPTGQFEFASFTMTSISGLANDSTGIDFDTNDIQIVDGNALELAFVVSSATLTLGGVGDEHTVSIGQKDTLVINIGGGGTPTISPPPGDLPQITFQASLAHTQNNPDLYFRLRVKDELFFLNNPTTVSSSCNLPGSGEWDFYVPMTATGGIYRPVPSISLPAPNGVKIAWVTADGWVVLEGVSPNKYYNFVLKGPKTRGSRMAEHVLLQKGQATNQSFFWDSLPLEPGDLPDPNKSGIQDCTVNAIDLSLIESRIGATGQTDIDISDVNYDGIVNGNDVSKVVNTLSTKPDDDQ